MQALTCAAAVFAWGVSCAAPPPLTLRVGDPAPQFEVLTWLKGEAVQRLDAGQVYVIEFWATRCVPCIKLMPHFSELARQYSGKATFVGVNEPYDWETVESVSTFVDRQGERMTYAVAMDFLEREQRLFARWAMPAGMSGYPAALIVDRAGRIAWAGSPALSLEDMETTLEQVVANTHDLAQGRARQQARHEAREADRMPLASVVDPWDKKDYPMVIVEADKLIAQDPRNEQRVFRMKLLALLHTDERQALSYARGLPEQYRHGAAIVLAVKEQLPDWAYQLAVQWLEEEMEPETYTDSTHGWVWSVIARAHYRAGNPDRAIQAQEKAIRCVEAYGYEKERLELKQTLQDYRAGKSARSGDD